MWLVGCGAGTGKISVRRPIGDGTAAGGNTFSNNKSAGGGIGVLGYDCVSPLTLDNNTFDGDDSGVLVTNHSGPARRRREPAAARRLRGAQQHLQEHQR